MTQVARLNHVGAVPISAHNENKIKYGFFIFRLRG